MRIQYQLPLSLTQFTVMHDSLKAQLAHSEEAFIAAIARGPEAIELFLGSWSALQIDVERAISEEALNEETITIAQEVATKIEILAGHFLELQEAEGAVMASFQNDLNAIFAQLNLENEVSSPLPSSLASVRTKSSNPSTASPLYIQPAYTWLMENLHNPYPSKERRLFIAQDTGFSFKDVDSWFINARKRIGWNALRMKHYKNKRSKIVDAATRFFKGVPQTLHHEPYTAHLSGIDPTTNHDSEFTSIENRARDLFTDKLFEISLATNFDDTVRDSKPDIRARAWAQGERRRQVAKYRSKDLQRISVYPSPEPSPERSLEPSPEQSPEPSPNSPPSIPGAIRTTSRKRCHSNRDSPEFDAEDGRYEPQKRSRMDSYQISRDLVVTSLPSPAASLSDIPRENSATPSDRAPLENGCIILPASPLPVLSSGKRKRRLSDAGNDGPSKRPHNALAVPRLQTVSDPLPLASPIISELHKTVFGRIISDSIPGPVSVESLDDTQVEVDFYSYNTSPDTVQPFWLAKHSGACSTAFSLPSAEISEQPSLDKSTAPDPSFDFLFETYLKDLDIPTPQASTDIPFFPDIPCHDHSALFSFENMLATQPPQEDILSDSLSYFQIPWEFHDNFSVTAPSTGTPSFSSLVTPQINPPQNEKEAKLKQIEALRAQLQNLEAEL